MFIIIYPNEQSNCRDVGTQTRKSCKRQVHKLETILFETGINRLSSVLYVNHHSKFG